MKSKCTKKIKKNIKLSLILPHVFKENKLVLLLLMWRRKYLRPRRNIIMLF